MSFLMPWKNTDEIALTSLYSPSFQSVPRALDIRILCAHEFNRIESGLPKPSPNVKLGVTLPKHVSQYFTRLVDVKVSVRLA